MEKTKPVTNIDELLTLLGSSISELKDGNLDVDLATELSNMSGKIIAGVAVQLKALELQGQYSMEFEHVAFLKNVEAKRTRSAGRSDS